MRVRVTNFTSVATVDFPLVLISGCVDNYSDQVILLPEKCIELMFGSNIELFDALGKPLSMSHHLYLGIARFWGGV